MCVLTVVSLMKSSRPISAFERPARDQAEDVELALGQLVEPLGGVGLRDARELLDHALRDARGEERVAGGDRADRRDELLGRVVLEHEAARAGAQRLVDVLVEVERRQDQDPRRGVGGEDAPRRLEAVELGHADVHQHDGRVEARRLVDGLEAVARLGDDLDVLLAGEQHAEAGANHRLVVGDEDADRHRRLAHDRQPRREDEPAAVRGAGGHLAAEDLHALADADEPVAEPVARRDAVAVVADLDLQLVGRVTERDVGAASRARA